MKIPSPNLSSPAGALVLLLGVAIASAVLNVTGVGQQLQNAVNGIAAKVPV